MIMKMIIIIKMPQMIMKMIIIINIKLKKYKANGMLPPLLYK